MTWKFVLYRRKNLFVPLDFFMINRKVYGSWQNYGLFLEKKAVQVYNLIKRVFAKSSDFNCIVLSY